MESNLSDIRVLLLQARSTPDIELQEQNCFLERCRIEPHQLISLNLARSEKRPVEGTLDGYDAFFIGGAGEFSVAEDYPWMPFALDLVRDAYRRKMPTFGSCWGHQLIARALGGTVEHDASLAELGCHSISLTDAGKKDELFHSFPSTFMANMGHHDRVTELPEEAIELARNGSQPFEAFRIKDRPIYGTQFHSELDAARERERLFRYRSYYLEELPTEEQFQAVLDDLAETTEVDDLMYDFLTMFATKS